jgi:NTE family protein
LASRLRNFRREGQSEYFAESPKRSYAHGPTLPENHSASGGVDMSEFLVERASGLIEKLGALPLFESIEPNVLSTIAADCEWFSVPGGQELFRQGDKEESLYVVLSGRLGAFIRNDDGKDVLVRQMLRGETVGEMAVLSGESRSATVVALRDTELIRLAKRAFDKLIDEHPKSLRFVTNLLVKRLREPPRLAPSEGAPKTVAIVPCNPELAGMGFARALAKAFKELGRNACVLDQHAAERPIEWFNALEADHDIVLYDADADTPMWTRLCLRQADRIVLLVDAKRPLSFMPDAFKMALSSPRRALIELVLHTDGPVTAPSEAFALMQIFPSAQHHHVRKEVPRDFRRLARMITGQAAGIVLSGGGARGLAHIGVLRALREAGIELDLFGGVSMGSIVAAGAALEWDDQTLGERMRAAFADGNPVGDYTLPLIALARGRRTTSLFRKHFGDHQVEDCPSPFFCVSANLTTSNLKVHRTGPIWLATRASTSIPGVLPPVIDGSDILIDGGILNNLPIDVMSEMRRGPIIAVDASRDYGFKATIDDLDHRSLRQLLSHARQGTPNILRVLMAATTISSLWQLRRLRNQVDLLIEPPLAAVSMLDWKSYNFTVEAGYRHTMELLEKQKGAFMPREMRRSSGE